MNRECALVHQNSKIHRSPHQILLWTTSSAWLITALLVLNSISDSIDNNLECLQDTKSFRCCVPEILPSCSTSPPPFSTYTPFSRPDSLNFNLSAAPQPTLNIIHGTRAVMTVPTLSLFFISSFLRSGQEQARLRLRLPSQILRVAEPKSQTDEGSGPRTNHQTWSVVCENDNIHSRLLQ